MLEKLRISSKRLFSTTLFALLGRVQIQMHGWLGIEVLFKMIWVMNGDNQ